MKDTIEWSYETLTLSCSCRLCGSINPQAIKQAVALQIIWQVSLIPMKLERSQPVWTAASSLTSIQTVQTDSQPASHRRCHLSYWPSDCRIRVQQ